MIKYVVKYVFFERARVWMYLLCDEVALLFFLDTTMQSPVSPVKILLFPRHVFFCLFLVRILNPNFKKMEREGHALPLCDKSDVNGCVA